MRDRADVRLASSSFDDLGLAAKDRVLILGGYGVRNVGDEAILAGLLSDLPAADVKVVSRNPAETAAMHHVRAVSPFGVLPALLQSDFLIVGGGGIFSRDTGPFGRFIPFVCRAAIAAGKRVAFHGVGVYPSTPAWILRSLATLAPKLQRFTVRDAASVETLAAAGVAAQRIDDLSASLVPASEAESLALLQSAGIDPSRPAVALCLTRLNDPLADFLRSAVPSLLAAMPETQFCLVPISQHQTNERHNDLSFGRELAQLCPSLKLLEGIHHPALVLGLFRHFDAAVCVRFHSFLFADRMGVPIVALPYAEKCESWLKEHDLEATPHTKEALITAVSAAASTDRAREPLMAGAA